MALTLRGRRTRFDNISVGNAAGRERTIAGGGGENTTNYGGKVENYLTACGSSFTSPRAIEHFLRTVCGDATTDQSNG